MNENVKKLAFVLLAVGTLGLLINEFVFSWGTVATLLFAATNGIGLVALALNTWVRTR